MSKTLRDMANAFDRGRYSFSPFLGLAEQSDFHREIREYPYLPYTLYGGTEDCERVMLRVGSEDALGYEEPFPICLLEVTPKSKKFADELTHRDFLGAVLHLGLERDTIGDIYIEDNVGYIFCTETVAPFLTENLDRIKHTSVSVKVLDEVPVLHSQEMEEMRIQASSLRLDLIIAKAYRLSRSDAQELFYSHKVFVDGRLCENTSHTLQPGQTVSVRGFGRLKLKEIQGLSRKGKQNLILQMTEQGRRHK